MTASGRAMLEAVLLGAAGGLISVRIVTRRLAFFTLAMTHATFPGVVLAAIAGTDLYLGGGLFGVLIVLGVVALSRRPGHDSGTAIGIMLSAGFALGVVLLSARDGFTKDLAAYTVGQILTVGDADLIAVAVVALVAAAFIAGAGKELTFAAFDPTGFAAAGYRAVALDIALLLIVEAVIVVAVPAVGAILAVALLVAPAATARLWTHQMAAMTAIAVAVGAGSGLVGVLASQRYDVAAGGAITLATGVAFTVSLAGARVAVVARRAISRSGRTAHQPEDSGVPA
jgi:ABC-type Mn2+/Zn2+ transport system permease subunit